MRVSFNWLQDHIEITADANYIADRLTMVGLEVEGVSDLRDEFRNVKTAKVLSVKQHPDADKLNVCEISTGNHILTVICGAPNVAAGQNVVIALPGADIPAGKVEKAVIRGVESHGMLCSEKELGLSAHSDGILVLGNAVRPGKDLWDVYPDMNDRVFEISITPNRGDCLSHIGIAREIAAFTKKTLNKDNRVRVKLLKKSAFADIKIEAPDLCPRYTAKLIKNVTIQPSPEILKVRLFACGMRPINNVVDITNYVMLDLGQPLHAFDYDKIQDSSIIVRKAADRERFNTLDAKERELSSSDLMIADAGRAIALAGVMGGENSEVGDTTKNILLESAFFNPKTVRKTAKRLGIPSEASYRFERGVDILNTPYACEKAAMLMGRYAMGEVVSGVLDCYPQEHEVKLVKFRPARCNSYLGVSLKPSVIEERLSSLGMQISKKREEWDVEIPAHRLDIAIEEDLCEEVARLGFYEEIKPIVPAVRMKARNDWQEVYFKNRLKSSLVDLGAFEVISYGFIREKELEKVLFSAGKKDSLVYIKNPLTEEATVMRPGLAVSHLSIAEFNHARLNYDFMFFEIGKSYTRAATTPAMHSFNETNMLNMVFSGLMIEKTWHGGEKPFDFHVVKGVVELLMQRMARIHIKVRNIVPDAYPYLHPAESAEFFIENRTIGVFGAVHPDVSAKYDLKREIYIAEIALDVLKKLVLEKKLYYYELSKYPWVDRDITVILDETVTAEQITTVIFDSSGAELKNVKLVDLFRGGKIPEGKKSLTFKLVYQSDERTLSDEEVNAENEKIARRLVEKLNVEFSK